ncbi:MAG: type II toxin-antitoxin system RelE/ParE family toxin [Nanoarchaeales archaeon]|nr:type II toxin-antitoxin system RelE/ParE family toxin [Nanoarchaeales archaeon]
MSYDFGLTNEAEDDLLKISLNHSYISKSHLLALFSDFDKTFENLTLFPNLGKDFNNEKEIYCRNYRILYEFENNFINILSIKHSKQNY